MNNSKRGDISIRYGYTMQRQDRLIFEVLAGFMVLASVLMFNQAEMDLGFTFGACGALLWCVVAIDARLWGLTALNVALFAINLNGAF